MAIFICKKVILVRYSVIRILPNYVNHITFAPSLNHTIYQNVLVLVCIIHPIGVISFHLGIKRLDVLGEVYTSLFVS